MVYPLLSTQSVHVNEGYVLYVYLLIPLDVFQGYLWVYLWKHIRYKTYSIFSDVFGGLSDIALIKSDRIQLVYLYNDIVKILCSSRGISS